MDATGYNNMWQQQCGSDIPSCNNFRVIFSYKAENEVEYKPILLQYFLGKLFCSIFLGENTF